MEDKQTFVVQDENGIQSIAELLTVIEVEGIEYAVYSIDTDSENSDIFVARLIKDQNGTDRIISIENEEERKKIFGIVEKMINES